jgi:hypothetical protein
MKHLPALVEVGLEFDHHRRAKRGARQLVGTAPQHAHRPARHAAREPRGIERHVVGAVVTVAARALHVLHAHRLGLAREREREVAAQVEDALAVCPHMQAMGFAVVAPTRERTRWADRRVRDPGLAVACFQRARHVGLRALAALCNDMGLGRLLLQTRERVALVGPRRRRLPARRAGQQRQRSIGVCAAAAQHAEQLAVANRVDQARHVAHDRGVGLDQARIRAWWVQHTAVQQPIGCEIVNETRAPRELARKVDTRQ